MLSGWLIVCGPIVLVSLGLLAWRLSKGRAGCRDGHGGADVRRRGRCPGGVERLEPASPPGAEATVSSKVTGRITEVLFDEGQSAEANQVLARVDPSNIQTSLDLAKAQLEVAESMMGETRAQLALAESDFRRAETLTSNRVDSPQELDRARADADSLKARLKRQGVEVECGPAPDRNLGTTTGGYRNPVPLCGGDRFEVGAARRGHFAALGRRRLHAHGYLHDCGYDVGSRLMWTSTRITSNRVSPGQKVGGHPRRLS